MPSLSFLVEVFIATNVEFGDFVATLDDSESMLRVAHEHLREQAGALAVFTGQLALRGGGFVEDELTGESMWHGARLKRSLG